MTSSKSVSERGTPSSGARDGFNADDPGLHLLADALRAAVGGGETSNVLAVHCGPLPGLACPHLVLDVRQQMDAPESAIADGLGFEVTALPRVDHAGVWPRAHLGKDFTFRSCALGALALRDEGRLWCAVKKSKGADSIVAFMEDMFGAVKTVTKDRGYRLLCAVKTSAFRESAARGQLETRYELGDERLRDLVLRSAPGVFSRKGLDAGTACLIDHADSLSLAPRTVLDLGAGIGPLTLWAALRFPGAQLCAIESNFIALDLLRENCRRGGVEPRVEIITADGWTRPDRQPVQLTAPVDLALVNPPTHADPPTLHALLNGICERLSPTGLVLAVVSRPGRTVEAFEAAGMRVSVHGYPSYSVVEACR